MSHVLRSAISSVSRKLVNSRHVAIVGLSTICIVAGVCAHWSSSVAALVFTDGSPSATNLSTKSFSIETPLPICTPPTGLIISEFRWRGANGVNDEFVEFYNNTDQNITICTADGSNGWALVTSDGVVRFVIPVNTLIPARAHFLAVGSGYGLASYAAGDLSYVPDTPDNLGLALFNSASAINFTVSNRLDAVGFSTTSNGLYKEGTGLSTLMSTNGQYSYVRKLTSGFPQDTGDNAADFTFIATDGGNYGVIAILGAPGPEGLTSPLVRNAQLAVAVIDPAVSANVAPNRVRDTTAIGPNAAAGTLTLRRKITNNTNGSVTRLRVRIVDITTLNTPGYVPGGGQADMRALSSNDITVTLSNGTQVLVRGTTLETPPAQSNGGGLHANLGVFAYSLSQPLAPGASTNVQFMLGVQQSGTFRFFFNVEADSDTLPTAITGGPYSGPTGSPIQFNGGTSFDSEGQLQSYQWNFGDNSFGSGPAPSHTYSSSGTYTVTLTVTDSGGQTNTGSTTATIYPASNKMPVPIIAGPFSAVTGSVTQFSASGSFDPDGTIAQYKWDFAGLGSATGPTPGFTFTSTGTHLISLTVTDNLGAKTLTSINVSVTPPPGGSNLVVGDSTTSDWDPTNRPSLDKPVNNRGNQPNTITGNNNFQLVAPVLSLAERGGELNLNLVYNSLVWNQSGNDMYFDIDHDSPAPGWHLGFGKMVMMGTAGCMLIEPDGSRHPFKGSVSNYHYDAIPPFLPARDIPVFKGETTDGSMIEYRCEPPAYQEPQGAARYPNGTVVHYTNIGDPNQPRNYLYPTFIRDKNGNGMHIRYTWPDAEPRIQRIVDTVGRVIDFHYDTQKRLTSITGPDVKDANGNPTTRTFVRLHYTTLQLGSGLFSKTTHIRNSTPFVIDAIYYPATRTGYVFGPDAYSSYGMLLKVTQQRDMNFTAGSTADEQGTITPGTVTRTQTYDYPAAPANLPSAPVYMEINETWDGGGTTPTKTKFAIVDNSTINERTVTVTNPDNTKTEQVAFFTTADLPDSDPNKFKNGLTKEERRLDSNGNLIQKTVFTWESNANGVARLQKTEITDERGQTLVTAYDQYGTNNSLGRTREYDYLGNVFRTTINTFTSYLDDDLNLGLDASHGNNPHPRLVNLVTSTKVFQGEDTANVLAAYTEFKYDEYAETLKAYPRDGSSTLDLIEFGESRQQNGITGILEFAAFFSPLPRTSTSNGGYGADYFTKRGNVTSISRYADTSNASAPAAPIIEKMKYDMAGNVISSSKICCEELSSNFDSLATQFAFPVSRTRGSADPTSLLRITTSTSYDLAIGAPISVTDANGRPTQTSYFSGTSRPKEIISATGSRIIFEYDDVAMKTVQTTRLSANGSITAQTTTYLNGLGQVKKQEALGANNVIDIVETLYDQFGRHSKQSLPYRTGDTKQWRETVYDAAGRVSEQRDPAVPGHSFDFNGQPIFPATKYFYNEAARPSGASTEPGQTTRTVDAWERSRWVRLDAAGRLAEVIEQNPAGGAGLQTKYTYNALNKLIRTDQGDQVRRFRYDSLGRLTHQKLAETEATLNLSGQWDTSGTPNDRWSEVFTYDDRSNVISKTDARGVKTIFKYKDSNNADDPLNRLQSISYDLAGVPAGLTVLPAATVTFQYRTKPSASSLIDVTQVQQTVATGVNTEDYSYDTEGRVQEKRITFAGRTKPMTVTYGYDALNRMAQMSYPEQYHDNITNPVRKSVTQSYDEASRVKGLKVNDVDYASQIAYNAASQMTSVLIGSGTNQLTETYSYDERMALTHQEVKRGPTTLMSLSYAYHLGAACEVEFELCNMDPRVYFSTGKLTLATDHLTGRRQRFSYDELGRLTNIIQGYWVGPFIQQFASFRTEWAQTYSYDRYGNRTGVSDISGSLPTAVPKDGIGSLSYEQSSNRINTAGFAYDPAGNQLQNGTGRSFVYDAAGRLVKVKDQTGAVVTNYTYGASNQRLITQTGNDTSTDKTYYIWEGNAVIAEYVEQTSATMPKWSKNYIFLDGRLLATEVPNGTGEIVQYHHPDRLSTKLVTNNLDTTSFTQASLPFGTANDPESTGSTNRRFTSYDRNTAPVGLDYAVNRHYDPRQGRFTQVDPLGMAAASLADPQSLNMYSYCGNDPVNRVDPDGQFWGALFRLIIGLFRSARPNVINGTFTYRNVPPISVSFTPNFQNIGVGFAGVGFDLRTGGQWLPSVLGASESFDPQLEYSKYSGPCPPTADAILKSGIVKEAIKAAYQKAAEDRDRGVTKGWIEHGGWILWKKGTNKFTFLIKEPITRFNSPRDNQYFDTSIRVWLHDAPAAPKGWEIVAMFHIHPNGGTGMDDGDPEAADQMRVPSFVGEPPDISTRVGSFNRGVWKSELPRRCR